MATFIESAVRGIRFKRIEPGGKALPRVLVSKEGGIADSVESCTSGSSSRPPTIRTREFRTYGNEHHYPINQRLWTKRTGIYRKEAVRI